MMGTWGVGHFDSDAAADFVDGIAERPDWSVLAALLQSVTNAGDNDDTVEYETALAAAAIVAHLGRDYAIGVEASALKEIATLGRASEEMLSLARASVYRTKTKSWLRASWEEVGQLSTWLRNVDELERALST